MSGVSQRISYWGRISWIYLKYQILTKGLLALLVFPLSQTILGWLLQSTGRTNLSSGDFWGFLLSFQGVGLLLLGFFLLALLIGTDINAFILMSAFIREKKFQITARQLLIIGVRSLRVFLSPSGFFLMLYSAIIVPLVGIGFTIAPMRQFQIPNFITDVIFKNPLYQTIYLLLLLFLTLFTLLHIFTFHHVLLLNQSIWQGLKQARKLMCRHWKSFLKDFLLRGLLLLVGYLVALFLIFFGLLLASYSIGDHSVRSRFVLFFGMFCMVELTTFIAMMAVPFMADRLTTLFYRYYEQEHIPIVLSLPIFQKIPVKASFSKMRLRTKVVLSSFLCLVLGFNVVFSSVFALQFDAFFKPKRTIEIVAHRGGGDLAAENTIASLQAAIKEGVAWSEIDVQRTKDGAYIIHHDTTFKRLTGDTHTSSELTFAEIQTLQVQDLFDSTRPAQKIATLDEFLTTAKGKIGLFIELKGKTADAKMADDVIRMVKAHHMLDEVVLLSLDYSLITYIEEHYPDVKTGFLYFFSLGNLSQMKGDILIMEEQEATPEKIDLIHNAGKKAIVWTVNTEESIAKFVNSNVDGIITDYVLRLKDGIQRFQNRSDLEIILDSF